LKRSPDTATPDDLRAYQLHRTDTEVTPPTFNARIMALRFLFGTTCAREEMKRYMQFRSRPRRLPTFLDIEEVAEVIAAAPGPGLKYRAALSIRYGAGLRASDVYSSKGCWHGTVLANWPSLAIWWGCPIRRPLPHISRHCAK
jgi:site-specific recombinase XerD